MIKSNTAERVADVNDAAGGGAGPNTSFVGGMRTLAMALGATALTAVTALTALTALTAVTAPAQGGLILNPSLNPAHRALGLNYLVGGSAVATTGGGAVGLRTYVNGVQQNLSSSMLSPRYVLAPLHGVTRVLDATQPTGIAAGSSLEISTGCNAQNNRGTVVQVRRIITFANTIALSTNLPDYCVLELQGEGLPQVVPVTLGLPTIGQMTTAAGFGSWAPVGGTFERDFWVRAGNAPIRSIESMTGGYNSEYYREASFAFDAGINLNERGGNGDSGRPRFGLGGVFLVIDIAGTLGTGGFGQTTSLLAGSPSISGNLMMFIPSPGSFVVAAVGAGCLAPRRRR